MAGTTPIYGLPYPQSSDLVSAYPALGQDLATDLDGILAAKANLASPTFTGSPAAPTATAGTNTTQIATTAFVQAAVGLVFVSGQSVSSASSVIFNNVFTSTYSNYRVVGYLNQGTAIAWMNLRFRASGSDNTTSNYGQVAAQLTTNVSMTRITDNGATGFANVGLLGDRGSSFAFDIAYPQVANYTSVSGITAARSTDASINNLVTFAGGFNATTQFDGFTLGNLTSASGYVAVYAYK